MKYKKLSIFSALLTTCLALSACNDDDPNSKILTWEKVRKPLGMEKAPEPASVPQTRYCYNSFQDIVCYGEPIPGQEKRLVAYQTDKGKTGYVMPSDGMDVKPTKVVELKPLKSVNVPTPTPVKGTTEQKPQLKEIIFDPAELEPKQLVPDKPQ